MSTTRDEIASQAKMWPRAIEQARTAPGLPEAGERVAILGCGTSWFIGQVYASAREAAGQGLTDAFIPTEFPTRDYDRVILLSRSGTTTEMVHAVEELAARAVPTTLITAVAGGPIAEHADCEIVLDYADEQSVVQTRFATSALALLRASVGHDVEAAVNDIAVALSYPLPDAWVDAEQISFIGEGWTIGLANEAALKCREASQSWTEAYPAMDYRHGPISIAQPGRLVWSFGTAPDGLDKQVSATGAEFVQFDLEPQATLVIAQRLAVARAEARGLNPDQPRNLTRAVILSED